MTYDPDSLLQLVQLLLSIPVSLKLPAECIVKKVTSGVLDQRLVQAGNRHTVAYVDHNKFIDVQGKILWGQYGVYSVVWTDEGKASHIVYLPTNTRVAIPAHCTILQSFVLDANWNDYAAVVSLGPSQYSMIDFFKDGEGPKSVLPWTVKSLSFKQAVQAASEDYHAKASALKTSSSSSSSASFVVPVVKSKPSQASAKAREALQNRRDEAAQKRRVSFV